MLSFRILDGSTAESALEKITFAVLFISSREKPVKAKPSCLTI
jgi:hypothetical protein